MARGPGLFTSNFGVAADYAPRSIGVKRITLRDTAAGVEIAATSCEKLQESGLKDEKAASVAIKRLRAVNGGLGMQLRGESIRITNELHSEG